MIESDVTIELTDLAVESLSVMPGRLPFGDDTVMVELAKRDHSLFLKCPISQDVLDGTIETIECILDGTLYCKECAELMANEDERCWVCNLMSFKEMLEISPHQ